MLKQHGADEASIKVAMEKSVRDAERVCRRLLLQINAVAGELQFARKLTQGQIDAAMRSADPAPTPRRSRYTSKLTDSRCTARARLSIFLPHEDA